MFRAPKQKEIRRSWTATLRREAEISPVQVSTQTRLNICKGAHPDATAAVAVTTTTETRSLVTDAAPAPDPAQAMTAAPANSKKVSASTATKRVTSGSTAHRVVVAVAAAAATEVATEAATEAHPETAVKVAETCATGEIASENAETTVVIITGAPESLESTAVKTVRATRDQPVLTREDPHVEAATAPATRGVAAAAAWTNTGAGGSTAPRATGADRPDGRPTEAKTISMSEISS